MPVSEWNPDELKAETFAAADAGIRAAAVTLVTSVKEKLSARGATYKMLKEGKKLYRKVQKQGFFKLTGGKVGKKAKRLYMIGKEAAEHGDVDPPGGYPRTRTGNLLRAASLEKVEPGRYQAGYLPNGAAHKYGAIHEFGGTIDHPGGQPFLMIFGVPRWISKAKAAQYGNAVRYTKPHQIVMPPRPVWGPSFKNDQAAMFDAFVKQAQVTYESGAQPPESAS